MSLADITRNSDFRIVNATKRYRSPLVCPRALVPFLPPGMTDIAADNQRLVEEDIFDLFRSDAMPLPILVRVGFIPFKTRTRFERIFLFRHIPSICLPYTGGKAETGARLADASNICPT